MNEKSVQIFIIKKCQKKVLLVFAYQCYWLTVSLIKVFKAISLKCFKKNVNTFLQKKWIRHTTEDLEIFWDDSDKVDCDYSHRKDSYEGSNYGYV